MEDSNPLIRALALRTMAYIHVREFVEATVPPTKKLLKDPDPYVRKTAAFAVAKLYDHDKNLVEASDLIDRLNGMLRDNNPTVVSSALAALMDIWERSETIKLTIDYASASKIVQILPDCSEYVSPPRSYSTPNDVTGGAKHTSWKLLCRTFLKTLPRLYFSQSESYLDYRIQTHPSSSHAPESFCIS